MALSDGEIRRKLTRFAADWGGYQGTERSEAQTFCNELLACYGTARKEVATFEERTGAGGFIDMIWPEVCLVEIQRALVELRTPPRGDAQFDLRPQQIHRGESHRQAVSDCMGRTQNVS